MRASTFLFLTGLLGATATIGGCGVLPSLEGPSAEAPTVAVPLDPTAAAAAISRYRAAHGLGPVTLDPSLARAAAYQAEAVAHAGYLSHEIGGTFPTRLAKAGFGGRYAAENLGAGATDFAEALTRWQRSPEHNKNLLMPQVQRVGVARVDAPTTRYKRYWALILSGT
jgi:uncharacterized protein YkwD